MSCRLHIYHVYRPLGSVCTRSVNGKTHTAKVGVAAAPSDSNRPYQLCAPVASRERVITCRRWGRVGLNRCLCVDWHHSRASIQRTLDFDQIGFPLVRPPQILKPSCKWACVAPIDVQLKTIRFMYDTHALIIDSLDATRHTMTRI